MNEAQRFAGRLRELREQAGLTQPQLADRAELSKAGIADLEQGRRQPTWETVVALAKALGVSCDAFLQEPTTAPPAGPGRPRKPTPGSAEQQEPKRPRGRPRKAPTVSQDTAEKGKATSASSGQEKPIEGQGRKRKGAPRSMR